MKNSANLRNTKFYKSLTPYLATAYAEGFCEGENATFRERVTAFQYLHDKGTAYTLQGFLGRTCQELLAQGIIKE